MGTPQDYRELEFKSRKLFANSLVSKVSWISIKLERKYEDFTPKLKVKSPRAKVKALHV